MKAAVSKAFRNIDDNYRVGYTTHSYTGTDTTSSSFLNIADFTIAQKNAWYTKMLGSGSSANGTPLIAALSKVGRIYAGRIGDNPVQYSCQQNFAILSTDGYWNNYLTNNSANVDGAAIGDQDGNLTSAPRPFYDGAGTQSNTLSDVAMYYYKTDLRPTMEDNVPGAGEDKAAHQHMTTFTLGLGVDGTLKYQSNYASAATGDFAAIKAGTKDWPTPVANTQTAVDDLWHAAVNGRGVYYSAKDPDSLTDGIEKALAGVTARTSTAAAAATSNLEPVAGDNFAYVASYQTVKWDGDLQARSIDLNTGDVGSSAIWSARDKLDTKVSATSDTRTIYFFDSGVASKLKPFTFANLNPTQQGYFNVASSLSQYPEIAATPAWLAQATGTNLVNYLRGQYQFEDQTGNPIPIFRDREHVLGDIVNGKPAYVKAPRHNWVDADYASYKAANVDRTAMVYVAANDGMLHAFDAVTGDEKWAFIPSAVMPNLYKLADKNYANNHRYTVDGSPVIEDVVIGGAWKTILIGGLNSGGRSYYALDITDPNSPKALWEFSVGSGAGKDADLGYTYGNAVVAKRPNGTWVVVVTSGYNNTGTGDGKGHFYLLDPATGNVLNKVSTTAGSAATPSGLGRINTWVDTFDTNNTAKRVYGGDLEGNLWSLNLETLGVDKLTTLKGSSGAVQPITTIPELGDVKGQTVIFVATGRYLGISDLTDTSTQSLYAIKDNLSGGTVSPRGGTMRQRTLTNTTGSSGEATRTVAGGDVDFETDDGWYVDFPDAGERANVDPQLVLGTLLVPTNVPNANSCNVGGYSWLNYFKYDNGLSVNGADDPTVGTRMGNALIVGMQVVRLPNKKTVPIISKSDSTFASPSVPFETKDVKGHRVSWREIFTK